MPLDPHRKAVRCRCRVGALGQPKTENTGRVCGRRSTPGNEREGRGAWHDRLQSSAEIAVAPAAARHFDDQLPPPLVWRHRPPSLAQWFGCDANL
jgi:hypothetical protein